MFPTPMNITTVPSIIKQTANGERGYDILSRILEDRVIMLCDQVTSDSAQIVIACLLYIDSISNDDITLYINSPGGSVTDGFAIYDTMQFIKSDVSTVCMGMAASMGAFLLSGGTKGKRFALPNSEIMIHQPLIGGGLGGQQTDIMIHAKNLERTRDRLESIMAANTGKTIEEIHNACERDNYLTAQEALDFGLIDEIITHR